MNTSQAARQAALRIANFREIPGDRVLADTYCHCIVCCARGGRLSPSLAVAS